MVAYPGSGTAVVGAVTGGVDTRRCTKGVDMQQSIDRKMDRVVTWAVMDRDVALWGKNDGDGRVVGNGGGGQGGDNRVAGENGSGVDGDNKSPDVFATDVANTGGRGAGNNARYIATLADVACCDLKAQGGVITFDELSDGVQAIEGIIGDFEVQR